MSDDWLGGRGKGWLKDYVQPKKEVIIKDNSEAVADGVIFVRPKCPFCGNKNARCYKTNENIRYYKCSCGKNFKAIEKED